MKTETNNKLKEVNTLNDYLKFLQDNFDTVNCKPGRLSKATVIFSLTSKLSQQNAFLIQNVKQRALESNNVKEFIEIIQANFNVQQLFTEEAKKNLGIDTVKLQTLTGLKEKEQAPQQKKEIAKTETPTPAKKKRH